MTRMRRRYAAPAEARNISGLAFGKLALASVAVSLALPLQTSFAADDSSGNIPLDHGASYAALAPSQKLNADERYRLGNGDRLNIRFYDRYDRNDLNGEYVIGESGQLRLPRVGVFDARNVTTDELENKIRTAVESRGEKLGYFTIEVAQCRPFYVTGLANKPGAYAYIPGMTVLHAVSLAGGLYRSQSLGGDAMREKRLLNESFERLMELIARRARLEVEASEQASIPMPKDLMQIDPVRAKGLMSSEQKLLAQSRDLTSQEKTRLEGEVALYQKEYDAYKNELVRLQKRQEEQNEIYAQLKKLRDEKYINQQRFLEAVTALDMIQRDKQTASTNLFRTTINLEKAKHDLSVFNLNTKARISRDIVDVQQQISRLELNIAGTRKVIASLEAVSNNTVAGEGVTYRIMRQDASGRTTFLQATETSRMMPGDVLEIEGQGQSLDVAQSLEDQALQ